MACCLPGIISIIISDVDDESSDNSSPVALLPLLLVLLEDMIDDDDDDRGVEPELDLLILLAPVLDHIDVLDGLPMMMNYYSMS